LDKASCGVLIESLPSTKSGAGPTDAALVVAARAGEAWAQEALFVRHAGRVLGLAQRMLGGTDEADDLVQDSFVQALGRLERLDNPQAFSAWLTTLVIHMAQKRLRRRRMLARLGLRPSEPIDPDALIAPNTPPDVAVELSAIYSVLSTLRAEERIALVLRRIEGMELVEVAEHMRLSLATVKRRLAAAESQVRRVRSRL
jgi:RNA polymerase sigma-70 factor, ECF subfamily